MCYSSYKTSGARTVGRVNSISEVKTSIYKYSEINCFRKNILLFTFKPCSVRKFVNIKLNCWRIFNIKLFAKTNSLVNMFSR